MAPVLINSCLERREETTQQGCIYKCRSVANRMGVSIMLIKQAILNADGTTRHYILTLDAVVATPREGECEQYTHKYSTYRVAQHDHISSREHAWVKSWKAQDCTSLCPKAVVIHVPCPVLWRT